MFSLSLFLIWSLQCEFNFFYCTNMLLFCCSGLVFWNSFLFHPASFALSLLLSFCLFPSIFAFLMAFFLGIFGSLLDSIKYCTIDCWVNFKFSDYFSKALSGVCSSSEVQDVFCSTFPCDVSSTLRRKRSSHSVQQKEDSMHQLLSSSALRFSKVSVWRNWDLVRCESGRRAGRGINSLGCSGYPSA